MWNSIEMLHIQNIHKKKNIKELTKVKMFNIYFDTQQKHQKSNDKLKLFCQWQETMVCLAICAYLVRMMYFFSLFPPKKVEKKKFEHSFFAFVSVYSSVLKPSFA